ncbi:MAG: PIN domain-containing protein [Sporichthyaceae bacterium]
MSGHLDTNVLIRHLTGDPAELAARATAYLAQAQSLILADLILAEIVYVLESFYEVERNRVAELARSIVSFPAIEVDDPELLLRTVELYERTRLDFADAYVAACAERSGIARVVSFDRTLDRVASIERIEPPELP